MSELGAFHPRPFSVAAIVPHRTSSARIGIWAGAATQILTSGSAATSDVGSPARTQATPRLTPPASRPHDAAPPRRKAPARVAIHYDRSKEGHAKPACGLSGDRGAGLNQVEIDACEDQHKHRKNGDQVERDDAEEAANIQRPPGWPSELARQPAPEDVTSDYEEHRHACRTRCLVDPRGRSKPFPGNQILVVDRRVVVEDHQRK